MEESNLQEHEVVEENEAIIESNTDTFIDEQEQVEEKFYTQEDIDALQAQVDELSQYKPNELTDDEVKIQEKLESIWQREVNATLKEEGLEIFSEFINAGVDDTDALNKQITKLKEIVGKIKLSNGYQPTNHKSVDGYSLAKKNKDSKSMISEKLNF
ncbi:xanthine phosphoribosyltransferase [Priestia aryabhattai]|uniref:xanthine phosphoribosyltransferase n=1 Tax=Priestia aryabhattai TaxID=412384 RepID=UPI0035AC1883